MKCKVLCYPKGEIVEFLRLCDRMMSDPDEFTEFDFSVAQDEILHIISAKDQIKYHFDIIPIV